MFALLAAVALAQDPAAAQPSLTARVNRAIARGVERVRGLQRPDGGWDGAEDPHPGGMAALCTFTLLKSGVRRGDEALQRGLKFVLATEFKSTYAHSVRLLMLDALAQSEVWRPRAAESLDFLVATQVEGQWAYPWGAADSSNMQFALLGLRAAHRMGLEVPDATTSNAAKALFRMQDRGGGFRYEGGRQPTGGMTAATLGGLCVLRDLAPGNKELDSLLRKRAKDVELGAAWLDARFEPDRNPYGPRAWTPGFQYPYLWAVERYGGLSGRATIGGRDWYAEGAEWLVGEQLEDGGWGALENTCFALLFLRRATVTSGDAPGAEDGALDARREPPEPMPAGGALRITDWLVAGPWMGDEPNGILLKPPFDPRRVEAKDGRALARREWKRVKLKSEGWTDLDELTGLQGDGGMYAVATTLAWPLDQPLEASIWFDFEDGCDVYLDGARVAFTQRVQGPIDCSVRVDVSLARGEHRLLCLVEDDIGAAACGARIGRRDGSALERAPEIRAAPAKGSQR